jgi:RNA polymerase sigma-70 factor, ECF subfamily
MQTTAQEQNPNQTPLEPRLPGAYSSPSPELIALCQQGDYDAFATLFAANKDRIYSIALRFSGDPAAAMDIAQDTFLKLLGQIRHFRAEARFETWLYRIVVNACLDHRKARRRWMPLIEDLVERVREGLALGMGAEVGAQRAEMRLRVRGAIAHLPADQRIAVVLRYTEGLSYEEIAEVTGCAAGTVASRLSRAHRALEGRLQDYKGGSR